MKPLSCQRDRVGERAGTPLSAAIDPICDALSRSGVGYGGLVGEPWARRRRPAGSRRCPLWSRSSVDTGHVRSSARRARARSCASASRWTDAVGDALGGRPNTVSRARPPGSRSASRPLAAGDRGDRVPARARSTSACRRDGPSRRRQSSSSSSCSRWLLLGTDAAEVVPVLAAWSSCACRALRRDLDDAAVRAVASATGRSPQRAVRRSARPGRDRAQRLPWA